VAIWLDDMSRQRLVSGNLKALVRDRQDGVHLVDLAGRQAKPPRAVGLVHLLHGTQPRLEPLAGVHGRLALANPAGTALAAPAVPPEPAVEVVQGCRV